MLDAHDVGEMAIADRQGNRPVRKGVEQRVTSADVRWFDQSISPSARSRPRATVIKMASHVEQN
jgi:hypothetical protein